MAARSGQITIVTAGTAVQGTAIPGQEFVIKAHPSNTGVIYVGNDGAGDVTSSNGFPLSAGDALPMALGNLSELWFDAAENGDVACWIRYG